ncbi:MAG: hypothetical protein N5P05_001883 [Chroococcopsis gigantea SAG 12.99]|jgi:RNA recognition motif-containing protein|nr:RNA-binding protein [Chlorogloea purpurea SAG 13.99]MDV3000277.1 hypothetical protein [Chroococcopsis gigantea SAG 12.99]
MSVRLYVGNLPKESIERQSLQDMFVDLGDAVTTKVIKDRKTGKCRGFAFVTVPTDELADEFIEKYNGQTFMDFPIKIEKALPRTKGKGKEEGEFEGEGPEGMEEGGETVAVEKPEKPEKPTPRAAGTPRKTTGERSGKKRKNSNSGGSSGGSTYKSSGDGDALQPDPRWADKLAQLKEMLATQTAN